MLKQEQLADLFLVIPAKPKRDQKRFVHITKYSHYCPKEWFFYQNQLLISKWKQFLCAKKQ